MKGNKLLMLGGADIQISAIKKAKEMGCYVITCDYLPDNPGHKYSDEYHNVSTTDKEAVLTLSQQLKIDGISAYASDPAALTAAYVSQKMSLPGNSYQSVLTLSDKFAFRKLQKEIGIPCPEVMQVDSPQEVLNALNNFQQRAVIKPVDTSGSKGIYRLDKSMPETVTPAFVNKVFNEGMDYSRMKRIIVEEYIPRKGFLMSGDFMVEKGKIIFQCFGDVHFNTRISGLVPRSISLPASKDKAFFKKVQIDLQKLVDKLRITTGVFNADVIENTEGEPVVIDIGARNGGNMFNDIIFYHSGVNLIELSLRQCCGEAVSVNYNGEIKGFYAHNVLHSEKTGTLEAISFSEELKPLIIFKSINKKAGDLVERFTNSSFRIGLLLLKFESFAQMHQILGNIHEHVFVKVK